jgi:hypothetical protein
VFVIFLDTYHTQIEGSATMRQPLINFINRLLGPDDFVALMTPEMAATEITLGRKTTVITKLLEREWLWGRRGRLPGADNDETEDLYDSCYPDAFNTAGMAREMKARRREKLTLDALEDLMVHLGGIRDERKAVVTVTEGWRIYRPDTQLARSLGDRQLGPGDVLLRPPRPSPSDTSQLQGSPRVKCEADAQRWQCSIPKFRLQGDSNPESWNVTFYPIYARGWSHSDAMDWAGSTWMPQIFAPAGPLRLLANIGAVFEKASPAKQHRRRAGAHRRTCRRTAGRGATDHNPMEFARSPFASWTSLTVRARKNIAVYEAGALARWRGHGRRAQPRRGQRFPPAPAAPLAPPSRELRRRVRGSGSRAAWSRRSLGRDTVWIVGEQISRRSAFRRSRAVREAEITVTGSDNAQVASRRLDQTWRERVHCAVTDAGGIQSGLAVGPPRSPMENSVIDTARISVISPPSLGDAVMWRRGPSTGPQHLRTADPRFQRSERLRLEFPTSSTESATARVIDRNGQAISVPVEVSTRPDSGFSWVVVDLGLAPFGPADYAIEVTQGQHRQITAFRVSPTPNNSQGANSRVLDWDLGVVGSWALVVGSCREYTP